MGVLPHVIVIGDVMLDVTVTGTVKGVSPEHDHVLVIKDEGTTFNLGGAANVASNLAGLGRKVLLVGMIGEDFNGHIVGQLCADHQVDTQLIVKPGYTTTAKHRFVTRSGQLLRVDYEKIESPPIDWCDETLKSITDCVAGNRPVIVFSDYNKGYLEPLFVRSVLSLARTYKLDVLVDPPRDPRGWKKYSYTNAIFKCNLDEAIVYAGLVGTKLADELRRYNPKDIEESHLRLFDALYQQMAKEEGILFEYAIVTLGQYGAMFGTNTGLLTRMPPATPHSLVDTTGAGDTFLAAMADWFVGASASDRDDMDSAVKRANLAASLAVAHQGVYKLTTEDLGKAYQEKR